MIENLLVVGFELTFTLINSYNLHQSTALNLDNCMLQFIGVEQWPIMNSPILFSGPYTACNCAQLMCGSRGYQDKRSGSFLGQSPQYSHHLQQKVKNINLNKNFAQNYEKLLSNS